VYHLCIWQKLGKPEAPSPTLPQIGGWGQRRSFMWSRAIINAMSDDQERQETATTADLSRPVATNSDSDYSLSIDEALARYEAAGLPRTGRSVQRYCAKGDLDAHRVETPFGEKFLITLASVERHISYIHEVRPVATGRDLPRQAATDVALEIKGESARRSSDEPRRAATASEMSRPVATDTRIVELLERENDFLRGQISAKDEQIKDLTERSRETNHLIAGLQKMLTPLLGNGASPRRGEGVRAYADNLDDPAP